MSIKRILLAGLLGGIVVYAWGAISWTILPWHASTMANLPNEHAVVAAMRDSIRESGVYVFPSVPTDEEYERLSEAEQQAWLDGYMRGPVGILTYHTRGSDPMSPGPFVGGLALNIVAALLAAGLLSLAVARLPRYAHRVAFVGAVGLFAALVSHVAQWNWGFQAPGYAFSHAVDLVIGWTLAGTILAWRIGPGEAG